MARGRAKVTKQVQPGDAPPKLRIELDIINELSSSGKSTLIASTGGYQESDLIHDGCAVHISVNAIIKNRGKR